MIKAIQKWRVAITLDPNLPPLRFFLSDDHEQNVLRTLATMQFDGIVQSIGIERVAEQRPQVTIKCGAIHKLTGTVCYLEQDHLEVHFGYHPNGTVQWPIK